MALLSGFHHLTFVTTDLDRLISFYERVFEAEVKLDIEEDGIRHALIEIGPRTYLHPYQLPNDFIPTISQMVQTGPLDHFALSVPDEETFRDIHRRIMAEGRDDGMITDMGAMLLFSFTDPDEGRHEIVWRKPDHSVAGILRRSEWSVVEFA